MARNRGKFGHSAFRHGEFAMICLAFNAKRPPWRCNSGRTANIATRTCRRMRRKRGSAPMNARSARIAPRTSCTMSARTAAAVLCRGRSGPRRNGGPGVCVAKHPPSDKRVHLKYSLEDVAAHSARLRDIRAGGSLNLSAVIARRMRRSNPALPSAALWIALAALLAMTGDTTPPAQSSPRPRRSRRDSRRPGTSRASPANRRLPGTCA